eukprot:CAMPEP_0174856522 /NCGR_PEP_ID=MMETSP1114-20130205/36077_1 /TAXON_ID=312471 /ORGANISM="Neobodo designis, Strain CCAP 1951/1" /LENGTH=867 /DNA_ID=CAMNT_0016091321 /DNA_START=170 /DNA_END=2773 /DNA_ORIENTATION=-
MGKIQMAKMVTAHFQFLGLLAKLNFQFPNVFKDFIDFSGLINLNFDLLFDWFEIPRIDHRVMFILVAIGVPLGLMILTALVFYSIQAILQFSCVVVAVLVMLAFILRMTAPQWIPDDVEEHVGEWNFFFLGLAILVGPIAFRIGRRLYWKTNGKSEVLCQLIKPSSVVGGLVLAGASMIVQKVGIGITALFIAFSIMKSDVKKQVRSALCFIFIGGSAYVIYAFEWSVRTPPQFFVPAVVLVILGIATCVEDFLKSAQSSATRGFFTIRAKIQKFMDTSLLTLALFGLQAAFVPVLTFCLDIFLCADYKCPTGTKFNPWAPRPPDSYTMSEQLFCDPCDFQNGCPFERDLMCPAYESRRLLKHPTVGCDEKGFTLFVVSAGLVLAVFLVVILVMYHRVIKICCSDISKEVRGPTTVNKDPFAVSTKDEDKGFKLKSTVDPTERYSLNTEWGNLLEKVDPKASSLYQSYRFEFRYFLLFETLHKALLVGSSVVIAPYYHEAVFPLMLAHFAMFAVHIGLQPMIDSTEHRLAAILSCTSTLTTIYALCIWQHPEIFDTVGFAIAMIIIAGAIPAVAAATLLIVAAKNKFAARKGGDAGQSEIEKLEQQLEMKLLEERQEAEAHALLVVPQRADDEDSDDDLLGPSKPPEMSAAAKAAAARAAEAHKKRMEEAEKNLSAADKKKLDKLKKKKEMSPEERMCDDLNTRTKTVILRFFVWFASPLLLISLLLTLFATLTGNTPQFLDASNVLDRSKTAVLNGYDSWNQFTDNCCCISTLHPGGHYNVTERWVCAEAAGTPPNQTLGGRTVDRARTLKDRSDTGLPIRGFCRRPVVPECDIVLVDGNSSVALRCNESWVAANAVTQRAIDGLW